jgi:hypothetical protein
MNKNIYKWVLVLSIVITLNLFFYFAINVFHKSPRFDNFCKQEQLNIQPDNKEQCIEKGGQWNENFYGRKPASIIDKNEIQPTGYCEVSFTCSKEFQKSQDLYNRNVFVILVILGIISLVLGLALFSNEVVSLGLSLGGVLSLIIGSIRYWSAMQDYIRVIILGVALIVLIWLAIKKFGK